MTSGSTAENGSGELLAAYAQPVLAAVGLEDVRRAIEARDDGLAATVLTERLTKGEPEEPERTRWYYLLGNIQERRGESALAKNAFREALKFAGPLRVDALLHLFALALQQRECSEAKQLREEVRESGADPEEVAVLSGEIGFCEGQREVAKNVYETAIAHTKSLPQKALYQVRLAEILSYDWGKGERREREFEDEVVELIKQARDGASGFEPIAERTSRIVAKFAYPERAAVPDGLRVESLAFAEELLDRRRWNEARPLLVVWEGETGAEPALAPTLCRVQFAQGRLATGMGNSREAQERFDWVAAHCEDSDLSARALFLSAGQFARSAKAAEAITRYAELERRFPDHRLADDARLKTAMLYRTLGSEKQFVEMLDAMPERYPDGDMTQEGLFLLALEPMIRRDWGAATSVLQRAEKLAQSSTVIREQERERLTYFLARGQIALGNVAEGSQTLRGLIVSRPMTYYMLLAHSVLSRQGAGLADSGIERGLAVAESEPAESIRGAVHRDVLFERVVALLAVGDLAVASERMLGLSRKGEAPDVFWTMVGLYAQAGAVQTALAMIKGRTEDFRVRWPTGSWLPFWQMAYPRPYLPLVQRATEKTKVPQSLIYAITREESEFDPAAVSGANAYGLMQLIVPTAVSAARGTGYAATAKTLLKPETNIALGALFLSRLLERFHGQGVLAIAGYNAGPGRPSRWLKERPEVPLDLWVESIEYAETRNYVKRVLSSRAAYRWLYGEPGERATVEPLEFTLTGP